MEKPPLDFEMLEETAELGMDELRELIDMYLTQSDEIVAGMHKAIEAGATEEVADLAHKFAGSCAVCGVRALKTPLRTLERCGREGRLSDLEPLVAEMTERLDLCRRLLVEYLAEKSGSGKTD